VDSGRSWEKGRSRDLGRGRVGRPEGAVSTLAWRGEGGGGGCVSTRLSPSWSVLVSVPQGPCTAEPGAADSSGWLRQQQQTLGEAAAPPACYPPHASALPHTPPRHTSTLVRSRLSHAAERSPTEAHDPRGTPHTPS